jgi:hypothetical protein
VQVMQRFAFESESKDRMQVGNYLKQHSGFNRASALQPLPHLNSLSLLVTAPQEQLLQSIREEHAREIQGWKDRLQRELQAQDEVCSTALRSLQQIRVSFCYCYNFALRLHDLPLNAKRRRTSCRSWATYRSRWDFRHLRL